MAPHRPRNGERLSIDISPVTFAFSPIANSSRKDLTPRKPLALPSPGRQKAAGSTLRWLAAEPGWLRASRIA